MKYDLNNQAYISPEELRKRGFVRLANGLIYKRTALEMIFEETDWLKNKYCKNHVLTEKERRFEETFNALNRLSAGQRLAGDYHAAGFETAKARDLSRLRVDGSASCRRPAYMDDALNRYLSALCSVPLEFRRIVRFVCIDEKNINFQGAGLALKTGLDFLIKHYLKLSTE